MKSLYQFIFRFVFVSLVLSSNTLAFTESRSDPLATILDPLVEQKQIPGYYFLVEKDGEKVYERAKGYADETSKLLPSNSTLYSVQGFTSIFTALAILRMVDEGAIGFSDPVSNYIPEFAELTVAPKGSYQTELESPKGEVTIKHLLTHTSGLTRAQGGTAGDVAEAYRLTGVMTMEALIESTWGDLAGQVAALTQLPLVSHPGESFQPSNGYDVLGRIIEIVKKKPLAEALESLVFQPLDLKNTSFFVPEDRRPELARMYSFKTIKKKDASKPKYQHATMLPEDMKNFGLSKKGFQSGSSGLISNARDFAIVLRVIVRKGKHANKQFISQSTMNHMLVHQLPMEWGMSPMQGWLGPMGINTGFSSGLAVRFKPESSIEDPNSYDFYFWGGLANTMFWVNTNQNTTGIFLTQLLPFRFPPMVQLEKAAERMFGKSKTVIRSFLD